MFFVYIWAMMVSKQNTHAPSKGVHNDTLLFTAHSLFFGGNLFLFTFVTKITLIRRSGEHYPWELMPNCLNSMSLQIQYIVCVLLYGLAIDYLPRLNKCS